MEYTRLTNEKKRRLIRIIYDKVASHLDKETKKELTEDYKSFEGALARVQYLLPPDPVYQIAPGGFDLCKEEWGGLINKAIAEIYSPYGISSVGEALIISNEYFKIRRARAAFFRGQSNIEWPLLTSMGRYFNKKKIPLNDTSKATQEELAGLKKFQKKWSDGKVEALELDLTRSERYGCDDAAWWILMQHYRGDCDYTRLLDITSSVFTGLYFASKEKIIKGAKKDGVLYLVADTDNLRHQYKDASEAWEQLESNKVESLFDTNDINVPRLLLTQYENERLKTQMGAFIWWPIFNEPHRGFYYLRIPADKKADIRKELTSYGYDEDYIFKQKRNYPARM